MILLIIRHGESEADILHVHEGSFFRTDDTGIHIWEITDRGCYVLAANRHDHAREK